MRQRRWIEILHEYDFEIKFRPGKENIVADALSRKSFLSAVSMPNNPIIDKVKELAPIDANYSRIVHLLCQGNLSDKGKNQVKDYTLHDDCLFFKQRLSIPKDPSLKKLILKEAHDSPTAGHMGYAKTINLLRKSYHWPGLQQDVLRYLRECLSCQRIKAERVKMPRKLQPLDIPR